MATKLIKIPTGYVFQTETVEVQLTLDEARELMSSVLVILALQGVIPDDTLAWLSKREG